jgi:ATP-binding cassette subfamily C protein
MAERNPLEESVASMLAATDPSAAAAGAPRFTDPLTDAFSVAATANGDRVREPDPVIERDLPAELAVAAASGLMIAPTELGAGWWHNVSFPMVLDPSSEAPAAVIPDPAGRAMLFPASSRTPYLVRHRSAAVGPAVRVPGRLPQGRRWWQLLRWSLRGQQRSAWTLAGLAAVTGLTALLLPVTTSVLFDYAIPWGDIRKALTVLTVFAIASAGAAILLLARNAKVISLRDTSDERLSAGLVRALLRLPMRFFSQMPTGELLNRALSVEQARTLVDDSVLMLILTSVFGLTNLLFLASLSAQIAVFVGVTILILVAASVTLQYRTRRALDDVLRTRADVEAKTLELIEAAVPIRVAGAEARAFSQWTATSTPWLKAIRARPLNAVAPLTALAPILIDLVLVVSVITMSTPITAREFVPAFSAVVQLTVAMTLLSQNISRLWELGPVLKRMDPITSAQPERSDQGRRTDPLRGQIALANIVFGYDLEQPPLFKGLSLTVAPGEFVAIVGPSGSGKTTLLRLLLGFEQPWSGIVEYDGNDLADLDVVAVRRQIGTVTQASVPFGATLRECICGPRVIDEERLQRVLVRSGLDDLAEQIGLDTSIGQRGSELSGGQQQRLMIARALVGEPRIMLLDEATSALDNLTQDIVMGAVMTMPATRIAIAHRLSTIERADRVLVVDGGRIVEEGTPSALRAAGGHFARLAARQEF